MPLFKSTVLFLSLLVTIECTKFNNSDNDLKGDELNYFEFFTSGIAQHVWEQIILNANDLNVTDDCKADILHTVDGIENGSLWAFKFLDASSKTPSGFLDGTVTSFGDYDQCLSIVSKNGDKEFYGQHCMINLEFDETSKLNFSNITSYMSESLPVFGSYNLNLGICMPSSCIPQDIFQITTLSHRYPFNLNKDIHCDTKISNTFTVRLANSRFIQKAALCFITIVTILVVIATLFHASLYVQGKANQTNDGQLPKIVADFSLIKNTSDLIYNHPGSENINFADVFKFVFIVSGLLAHSVSCLETPLGFYVTHRLHDLGAKFGQAIYQPFLNINNLKGLTFLGGCLTFMMTFDPISAGNFRYVPAVLKKWLRFLPSIVSLLALDLLWPMTGDGPMFSQVANRLVNKCSQNWWMNILFISNHQPSVENCIPHTFYSSIDLQLFIIGLTMTYLISRNRWLGLSCVVGMVVLGNTAVLVNTKGINSPVFLDANVTQAAINTIEYIDKVHFPTYSHISDYCLGLLFAYSLKIGSLKAIIHRVPLILISVLWFGFGEVLRPYAVLHNVYRAIPREYYNTFIVAITLLHSVYFFLIFSFLIRVLPDEKEKSSKAEASKDTGRTDANNNNGIGKVGVESSEMILSFSKALAKLGFSIYMINYFYIRYDFFTSRVLLATDVYSLGKRGIYTLFISTMLATVYHLFFVAPFQCILRILQLDPIVRHKKTD